MKNPTNLKIVRKNQIKSQNQPKTLQPDQPSQTVKHYYFIFEESAFRVFFKKSKIVLK